MSETFVSMADARRVAVGRKMIIDDLKKKISALESENNRLKSILKQHGIDPETGDKIKFKAITQPSSDNTKIMGFRSPTNEEIDTGKAQWCWTCGNRDCPLSKQDILMICDSFVKRTKEDMESDPHFGGHGNEE